MSPIDKAISSARKELEKNTGVNFESVYTCSKLIGHGAFAKVSICEHNQTKAMYAAKVVTKSQDDPEKQREGQCCQELFLDVSRMHDGCASCRYRQGDRYHANFGGASQHRKADGRL